jgi:hypothetical protein
MSKEKLEIRPIELKEANAFIEKFHRHHHKVQGHKFSISCWRGDKLVGVAIVGRPVSRYLDNGKTLEITRLCTDGTYNACSKLYSACARIAKEMGYEKIITYILQSESGSSLKASGWQLEEENVGGKQWTSHGKDGKRFSEIKTLFGTIKKYPQELKKRYIKYLK